MRYLESIENTPINTSEAHWIVRSIDSSLKSTKNPKTHFLFTTKHFSSHKKALSVSEPNTFISFFPESFLSLPRVRGIEVLYFQDRIQDCIVQWLTRSPDTREIPSSSLGIVIFPLLFTFSTQVFWAFSVNRCWAHFWCLWCFCSLVYLIHFAPSNLCTRVLLVTLLRLLYSRYAFYV